MRILLLGKDGQVGTELRRTLLPLGELTAIGRQDLNLENLSALSHLLSTHQPDIIVNAAAYTAVDKAEGDKHMAFLINAHVVKTLADYAQKNQSLLVHYSTDYVFDGQKAEPYVETDHTNPSNVYGASKHAGEDAIIQSHCNFLIFRTSWVFSVSGNNFIKTILKLAREKDCLRVVSDQHGVPTSAELIADVTAIAIANYCKNSTQFCLPREGGEPCLISHSYPIQNGSPPSRGRQEVAKPNKAIQNGIYHLTASGSTTWYDLARYIVDRATGMALKLNSQQIHPISTNEYPLPAQRPENSILNNYTLSSTLTLHFPDWKVHVDRVIDQLTQLEKSA